MATATESPVTQLSTLVKSPRTLSALKQAGYSTVEDLKDVAVGTLAEIPYVGPATLEALRDHTSEAAKVSDAEIEEGPHDLHIHSPHPGQMIIILSGDRTGDKVSGMKIIPGVYVKCRGGRGTLTRDQWLTRIYRRDRLKVDKHVADNQPWRQDAADWLRRRKAHGRSYIVLDN